MSVLVIGGGVLILAVVAWYVFVLVRRIASFASGYTRSRKTSLILAGSTIAGLALLGFVAVKLGISMLALVFVLYVLLGALVMDIVGLVLRLAYRKRGDGLPRWWSVTLRSLIVPLVFSLAMTDYGISNMAHVTRTDYTVTSPKLERDYTVLFISDTHYGTVQDKDVLTRMIDEMKALTPDLVILGGDIVDEGTDRSDITRVFSELAQINPSIGMYYIWGNHDRSEYRQPPNFTEDDVVAAIEDAGIVLLSDESLQVSPDLTLIGRNDYSYFDTGKHTTIGDLVKSADVNTLLLALEHQPKNADDNASAGVDVQLSGHTHAGQIWPFGALVNWVNGSVYGQYTEGDFTLIVSSGFAGWGVPARTEQHCEYVVAHLKQS